MSRRLENKVAVITGTASGMGRAAAIRFAAEGCKIVGCDLNVEKAQETVKMVKEAGGETYSFRRTVCNGLGSLLLYNLLYGGSRLLRPDPVLSMVVVLMEQ